MTTAEERIEKIRVWRADGSPPRAEDFEWLLDTWLVMNKALQFVEHLAPGDQAGIVARATLNAVEQAAEGKPL